MCAPPFWFVRICVSLQDELRWKKGADQELGKTQRRVALERRNEGKPVWDQTKPKEKNEGGTRKGRTRARGTKRKSGDDSDDDLPLDQRAEYKKRKTKGATTEGEPEVRPPQSPQVRPSPSPPPRICALPTGE